MTLCSTYVFLFPVVRPNYGQSGVGVTCRRRFGQNQAGSLSENVRCLSSRSKRQSRLNPDCILHGQHELATDVDGSEGSYVGNS